MIWFEMVIDGEARIGNHPDRGHDHWGCSFHFLDAPRRIEPGAKVKLVAQHDTTTVDLRFV